MTFCSRCGFVGIHVGPARRERAAEPCCTGEGKRPTHPAARAHHLRLDRAAGLMAMRRRRLPLPLEQICTVAAACHWRVVDAPSPTTWRLVPLAYELRTQDKPLDAIITAIDLLRVAGQSNRLDQRPSFHGLPRSFGLDRKSTRLQSSK